MSEKELIEKIEDICHTNIDVDWSVADATEEFTYIVNLIHENL